MYLLKGGLHPNISDKPTQMRTWHSIRGDECSSLDGRGTQAEVSLPHWLQKPHDPGRVLQEWSTMKRRFSTEWIMEQNMPITASSKSTQKYLTGMERRQCTWKPQVNYICIKRCVIYARGVLYTTRSELYIRQKVCYIYDQRYVIHIIRGVLYVQWEVH